MIINQKILRCKTSNGVFVIIIQQFLELVINIAPQRLYSNITFANFNINYEYYRENHRMIIVKMILENPNSTLDIDFLMHYY